MNVLYLTIGLCLSLSLQVSCNEGESQSYLTSMDSLTAGVSEFVRSLDVTLDELERNPIHLRSKRSADPDECHALQTQSLPAARQSIYGAWNTSMNAIVSMSNAFNDAKNCRSWNLFVSVPCGIKASIELYKSVRDNKAELRQFFSDIKEASADATEDFVACAKILLAHSKKTS